ncbi:sensor histidine kinase [Bacillus sp. JJ722]|uniref:sensor histidine kinase n=1 Tax=Bacillus sp. JJ722 TaxID=3122973 RepID=UPI002FFE1775
MKKYSVISYILGIVLGSFLLTVFTNFSFFVESIQKEVLVYSAIRTSNLDLLVWSLFFIGILFVVSAFQTNFYIKQPDDKAPLYFSVYCWIIIAGTIVTIMPYGNWVLLLKLAYIFNYISILALHVYIHSFLNKKIHPFLTKFIWINVGILVVLTVFTNVHFMVILLQYSIILSFFYFIYIFYLSLQKLRDKTIKSIGNFISVLIFIIANIQHVLIGYQLIEGDSLMGLGLFVFFIIHSALNMERFLNSYSETIEMKRLLQEKVKERTIELEKTNKEIRRIQTEKSQITSDICHDLSNPITSISMITKGIIEDVIPATDKQYLVEILNKSKLMEKLLEDLRQLNMLESNQINFHLEKMDWYLYMERIFNNYRANLRTENIEYELHIEKSSQQEAAVMIDPIRMEQVFFNIISNSVKYTPVGGSIEVIIGLDDKVKQAFMMVSDSGIGIDSTQLPHIYDRFYRTEPFRVEKESTGLGLNIVKSIIARHKGSIHVESEKGKGTIFIVNIPLVVE